LEVRIETVQNHSKGRMTPGQKKRREQLESIEKSFKSMSESIIQLMKGNYIDRQVRKDTCNHVHETVHFSRCPSAMMRRMVI
ncbi:MAG: hypothetical protein KZQ81_19025, partial [Candidatus Thiodiazotropha sp. (ex Rostrolucina anterorostrata)]|nr:hypothetical protein [Candidatus Thiodiazotropha sp. (ex Rostrolucina anterorostrata)]